MKGFQCAARMHVTCSTYATEFGVKGRYTFRRSMTEAYLSTLLAHYSLMTMTTDFNVKCAMLSVRTCTRTVARFQAVRRYSFTTVEFSESSSHQPDVTGTMQYSHSLIEDPSSMGQIRRSEKRDRPGVKASTLLSDTQTGSADIT